jgi:hypothetical protein
MVGRSQSDEGRGSRALITIELLESIVADGLGESELVERLGKVAGYDERGARELMTQMRGQGSDARPTRP